MKRTILSIIRLHPRSGRRCTARARRGRGALCGRRAAFDVEGCPTCRYHMRGLRFTR